MRRLALAAFGAAILLASPVLAADSAPWTITHMGARVIGPLVPGDLIVGLSYFDGTRITAIDGVVIHPTSEPAECGPSLGPTPPVT